jgi:hypothetical protein
MIYAVDFDQRALQQMPDQYDGVTIRKIIGDSPSLSFPSVEGVLIIGITWRSGRRSPKVGKADSPRD